MSDAEFLREAIDIAEAGVRAGAGGPFGALVVREGRVLGRGSNRVLVAHDPSAHAEVVAIRAACAALDDFALAGCTLYASCEPCPMCLGAIHWARIARVVYACDRREAARAGFDDERLHAQFALPPERRGLRLERLELEGARRPFELWLAKPDRVPY